MDKQVDFFTGIEPSIAGTTYKKHFISLIPDSSLSVSDWISFQIHWRKWHVDRVKFLFCQPIRIRVCYWKTNTDAYSVRSGFPVFCISREVQALDGSMSSIYGTPDMEYPGHIKVWIFEGRCLTHFVRCHPNFCQLPDLACYHTWSSFPMFPIKCHVSS